jgi:glycine C-acetyltransferase
VIGKAMQAGLDAELEDIREARLYKAEHEIGTVQGAHVRLDDGRELLNLCANNYLGLASNPEIVAAAHEALDRWGFGMASVRFICGTQTIHHELEQALAGFLGTEDAILYSSCFDANGAIFEALLGADDAVISDELNHASIIDGIRLSKARRLRYRNRDIGQLEERLIEAADARYRLIATDGVFSMDGHVAPLDEICALAEPHDALVMVDDSHATGFVGEGGRGTPELFSVMDKVDILTGTLGKAMGGASGGYVASRRAVVEILRQRSRPYLFSNSIPPSVAGGSIRALELIGSSGELREALRRNTAHFRRRMTEEGFDVIEGDHPIVPIMIGDAAEAARMADALVDLGIYVVAFSYPVVPNGAARIRAQMSAEHTLEDLDFAIEQFVAARSAKGS